MSKCSACGEFIMRVERRDVTVCHVHARDGDFQKFNDRGEEMLLMKSQYRKMEMRLESYDKTQEQMEDSARSVSLVRPPLQPTFKYPLAAIGDKYKRWKHVWLRQTKRTRHRDICQQRRLQPLLQKKPLWQTRMRSSGKRTLTCGKKLRR